MATAKDLRIEFTQYMDAQGIKYTLTDEEDNIVRLSFAGREHKGGGAPTVLYVDFDEKEDSSDSVHFVASQFAACTLENYPKVLVKVNDYNAQYRWVKFYVKRGEDKAYLNADTDAMLIPGSSALECVKRCFIMSEIVENVILDLGDLVIANDGKDELRMMLEALKELLGEE